MDELFNTSIHDVLSNSIDNVIDHGPLPDGLFDFKIITNKDEISYLEVYSKNEPEFEDKPVGSRTIEMNKIILLDVLGFEIIFSNAFITSWHMEPSQTGQYYCKIRVVFSKVEKKTRANTTNSIVEIVNVDSKLFYMWPTSTSTSHSNQIDFEIKQTCFKFSKAVNNSSNNFNAISFKFDGKAVSLIGSKSDPARGYLLFEGDVDEQQRDKIRWCISFSVGQKLEYSSYIGLTYTGTKTKIFFKRKGISPPITSFVKHPSVGNGHCAKKIAIGLFNNYEKLDLGHVLNSYFDTHSAPEEKKGVYMGAAIEALQHSSKKIVSKKIINDKFIKKNFIAQCKNVINGLELDDSVKDLLNKKVDNFNNASQPEIQRRYMKNLGMDVREVELNAWQRRNDAAHGNKSSDDLIKLVDDNIALQCFFNRLLLSLATDCYLYKDYYSEKSPIRHVSSCIPVRLKQKN